MPIDQSVNQCHSNSHCSCRTVRSWKKVGFWVKYWAWLYWMRLSDVAWKIAPDPGGSDGNGTIPPTKLASANDKDWLVRAGAQLSESFFDGQYIGMLDRRHSDNGTRAARSYIEFVLRLVASRPTRSFRIGVTWTLCLIMLYNLYMSLSVVRLTCVHLVWHVFVSLSFLLPVNVTFIWLFLICPRFTCDALWHPVSEVSDSWGLP